MQEKSKFWLIISLLVVGVGARLIPHYPNFTPLESIAIFGAAYLSRTYWAVIIPMALWYIADLILNNTVLRGFYPEASGMIWYSSYMMYNLMSLIVIVLVSKFLLHKITVKNIFIAALSSSILFFLITNAGAWMSPVSIYPKGFEGLIMSYTAGLPFLTKSILGNMFFCTFLFGSYHIIGQWIDSHRVTANK